MTSTALAGFEILIVGGTKGIGLALASLFASNDASVTVVGRTFAAQQTQPKLSFISADVSSMKACKALVNDTLKNKIFDMVVFTQGIVPDSTLTRTAEGLERDLAVSYLSRFVIAQELLKNNQIQGRKRIYVMGYPGEKMNLPIPMDLNFDTTPYKMWDAQKSTILGNEALVIGLAKRYPDVNVYGLNPGVLKTDIRLGLYGDSGFLYYAGAMFETLIGWFMPTVDQYAQRSLPVYVNDYPSGSVFSEKNKLMPLQPWIAEPKHHDMIWTESEKLVAKALAA